MINSSSGFTLVEFLVAILILMVGLLGMLQGINVAMSSNLESLVRNEAVSVADELMTLKRSKSFDSMSTTTTNPAWSSVQRNTRNVYKNYSVQQIITPLTTDNSKQIVVNVTWNYKKNKATHSVSSVVSKSFE